MSSVSLFLITTSIILLSSGLQSMTGFGFAVLAVPMLVVLLDPRDAVSMSMVLSTLSVVLMWLRTRRHSRLPINKRLFIAALIGLPFGLLALGHLDLDWLRLGVGAATITIAVVFAFTVYRLARQGIDDSASPPASWPARETLTAGFVSGFLTGSLSMPGPPVVALISGRGVPKSIYRATLLAYFALIYPTALLAMVAGGLIKPGIFVASLMHLPALVIGMWLGDAVHDASNHSLFVGTSLVLLAGAGLFCVWTGIAGLGTG